MTKAKTMITPASDPRPGEYEAAYMSFCLMVQQASELNHRDHDPKPETFGITESEAKWIRARVDKELARTA